MGLVQLNKYKIEGLVEKNNKLKQGYEHEWELANKVTPSISHDKATEIEETRSRLKKISDDILEKEISKKATKFDTGKPSFTSIPQLALLEVAKGFTIGKEKYGQYNYSGKMEVTRYLDALHRHLNAYLTGESIDESGIHHLGLVCCNALMALDGIYTGNTIENTNKTYNE